VPNIPKPRARPCLLAPLLRLGRDALGERAGEPPCSPCRFLSFRLPPCGRGILEFLSFEVAARDAAIPRKTADVRGRQESGSRTPPKGSPPKRGPSKENPATAPRPPWRRRRSGDNLMPPAGAARRAQRLPTVVRPNVGASCVLTAPYKSTIRSRKSSPSLAVKRARGTFAPDMSGRSYPGKKGPRGEARKIRP
jgi:hypothetical protein